MACAFLFAQAPQRTRAAAADKVVKRIAGDVGWQTSQNAPYQQIVADQVLPDDAFIVTRAGGVADLILPDSSVVRVAQAATVKVGAFSPAETGKDNYITIYNGSFRFKVTHPAGGQSNYRFVTPTSQIAVRGTEGLGKVLSEQTQVSCTQASAPDDVRVAKVLLQTSYLPPNATPNELRLFLRAGDPLDEVAVGNLAPEPNLIAQFEVVFTALAQGFTATVTVGGVVVGQFVLSAAALGVAGSLSAVVGTAGASAIAAGTTAAAGAATGTAVLTGAAAAAAAGALAVAAAAASSGVTTASPSPTPVPPTPTPSPPPSPSPAPTPTPPPTSTPSPVPTPTPSPSPSPTPSPSPSASPTPSASPSPPPTPVPTATVNITVTSKERKSDVSAPPGIDRPGTHKP